MLVALRTGPAKSLNWAPLISLPVTGSARNKTPEGWPRMVSSSRNVKALRVRCRKRYLPVALSNLAREIAQLGTTYLTASNGIGPEQDAGRLAENGLQFRNVKLAVGCESDTCRTPNRACEIAQLGTTYLTASNGIGPEQDAGRLAENGLQFRNVKLAVGCESDTCRHSEPGL